MDSRLPVSCLVAHPVSGEPIMIKRGALGYFPAPDGAKPRLINEAAGVSPEQAQAMLAGSLFGWGSELASPTFYEGRMIDPYLQSTPVAVPCPGRRDDDRH